MPRVYRRLALLSAMWHGVRALRVPTLTDDWRAAYADAVSMRVLALLPVLVLAAPAPSSAAAGARAARTVTLSETGRLHLTSSHQLHLNEVGSASGTIRGQIYIHLNVSSQHSVSAEVNIYPGGGSLSGDGSASYHVVGGYADFSGSLSITRGTGTYAHANARDLRFTGSIQRSNDAVQVKLSGTLRYQ